MVRVAKRFVDETLWPEYQQLAGVLRHYLDDVTERIIATAVHGDTSEAKERAGAPLLGTGDRED